MKWWPLPFGRFSRTRPRSRFEPRDRSKGEDPEEYYLASSGELVWRAFRKHKLAMFGLTVLGILYVLAIFAGFFSPYDPWQRHASQVTAPPTAIRFIHEGRPHWPFVYGANFELNLDTLAREYQIDREQVYNLRFFVRGEPYELLGLFPTNVRFVGVEEGGKLFLFGTDSLGRDVYSRVLQGARISLSIGLIGVAVSFILGITLGGISGYFGGAVDMVIQRIIEFLGQLPHIPLWMALAAAVPTEWPPVRVYFMITLVLSILGWTGLARTVRGKILQLRTEDYVMAARFAGASQFNIIRKHLLPGFASYLIIHITLAIPEMILGETALSFIGVGLKAPVVSWGVMLQEAQNVRTVAVNPWLMLPALFVIVTVLCFNFVGDGLRDSADPHSS